MNLKDAKVHVDRATAYLNEAKTRSDPAQQNEFLVQSIGELIQALNIMMNEMTWKGIR